MKIDRFTWAVIGIVLIILVGAVISVNLTGGEGVTGETYLEENTPAAPVYNAFVAFQNGDVATARAQYSRRVLDEELRDSGYNPFSDRFSQDGARRLRIVEVSYDEDDPNRAYVTAEVDTYQSSGPFGTGSTWSRRLVLDVVREADDGADEESGDGADDEPDDGADDEPDDGAGAGVTDGEGAWKLDTLEFYY